MAHDDYFKKSMSSVQFSIVHWLWGSAWPLVSRFSHFKGKDRTFGNRLVH